MFTGLSYHYIFLCAMVLLKFHIEFTHFVVILK